MKKKYPIFYLPPADKDLQDIFDFIGRDSSFKARRFLAKIDRMISRLSLFPLSGAIPRDPFLKKKGYRIIVVDHYLVFYRFEKKTVFIFRAVHGKRKYQFLLP